MQRQIPSPPALPALHRALLLSLFLLATLGCAAGPREAGPAEGDAIDPAVAAQLVPQIDAGAAGLASTGPLKQRLIQALTDALAAGPPEEAISFCQLEAPAIAAAVEGERGLALGRTSHRLRNPANAPRPWVEPLLAWYQESPGETSSRVVALEGGAYGYVEPIYAAPLCLACHGQEITPPVRQRLKELYPEDRATGFAAGDFRGLFWVEIPPPAPDPGGAGS